jgi:hypothetical protein
MAVPIQPMDVKICSQAKIALISDTTVSASLDSIRVRP